MEGESSGDTGNDSLNMAGSPHLPKSYHLYCVKSPPLPHTSWHGGRILHESEDHCDTLKTKEIFKQKWVHCHFALYSFFFNTHGFTSSGKTRETESDNIFWEKWEWAHSIIEVKNNPLSLICKQCPRMSCIQCPLSDLCGLPGPPEHLTLQLLV